MKKTVSLLLLSIACTLCILTYTAQQKVAAKNAIRLHVIANSDTQEDQAVKLLVRDRLLSVFADYAKTHTKAEAEEYIQRNLPLAQTVAKTVLEENDFTYNAVAQYGEYDFPVRHYGDVTLPAGKYYGLRILLGEAKGQNWWCVMYPPLCFNELNTHKTQAESETIDIQIKFKFLELLKSN